SVLSSLPLLDALPISGQADKVVYNLAPILAVIPAILILAVIPWMPAFQLFGQRFEPYFAIAPGIDVGLLFILAITSISVYGVVLDRKSTRLNSSHVKI